MAYYTDKELLERFEYYTMQVEERLLGGEDFKTVGDRMPMTATLGHPKTFEIVRTNKAHTELTHYPLEKLREEWMEYLVNHVHLDSIKNILKFLPPFYASQEPHQTMAFVQYVKVGRDSDYSSFISFTKPSRLPDKHILWLTCEAKEFGKMSKKVEQVIRMDEFKLKHFKRYQQLTSREVEILKLLANGCNNPQIAERLFISRQTVETHRKHIKRKLEIRSLRDLMRYAFVFDLIEY